MSSPRDASPRKGCRRLKRRMATLRTMPNWPRQAAASALCHLLAVHGTVGGNGAVVPPPLLATVVFSATAAPCIVCGLVWSACTLPSLNACHRLGNRHLSCNTAAAAYAGDAGRLARLLDSVRMGVYWNSRMLRCARSPSCARALLAGIDDCSGSLRRFIVAEAMRTNTATAIAVLLEYGGELRSVTSEPLLSIVLDACRAGRVGVLRSLHQDCALPILDAVNPHHVPASPLHAAAEAGRSHVVDWFLATYGLKDVQALGDTRDRGGRRPLDIAAERGHAACVERLLALGPAIGCDDCSPHRVTPVPAPGFGAIQRAALRRRRDVLAVLLQRLRESAPGDYDACVEALRGCGVAPIVETCAAVLP